MSAIERNLLQNAVIFADRQQRGVWSVGFIAAPLRGGGFTITDANSRAASDGCWWRSARQKPRVFIAPELGHQACRTTGGSLPLQTRSVCPPKGPKLLRRQVSTIICCCFPARLSASNIR